MLADINKLTTDLGMAGEKGGWCGLRAHMGSLEGYWVQKTGISQS